nr:DUF2089 family protein [Metabacillus litoralis]
MKINKINFLLNKVKLYFNIIYIERRFEMNREDVPEWILSLDVESLEFIRKFILNSGSLKEVAKIYGVSYPTVRAKLDKLIKKVELNSKKEDVEFINMIKNLVIDERVSLDVAKVIIEKYKSEKDDK